MSCIWRSNKKRKPKFKKKDHRFRLCVVRIKYDNETVIFQDAVWMRDHGWKTNGTWDKIDDELITHWTYQPEVVDD